MLITAGAGVVLISQASVPVYTSNWGFWGPRIRGCESGSGPTSLAGYTAQNRTSTASGAYQFLDSTWGHYKGYAKARLAPPEVQEEKAYLAFASRGTRPWMASYACWRTAEVPHAPVTPPATTPPTAPPTASPTILNNSNPPTPDLEPLIPGAQDVASEAQRIKYVSTKPADGLDPWVGSPVIQFLRVFGLFRT